MYKSIPLSILLAAVPAVVQAQTSPIIEIAPKHGHTFYFKSENAVVVKAWPASYSSFDFGEHPGIPNARFIYVNLKPKSKIKSTTLTVIYREGGKDKTKTFLLRGTNSIPKQFETPIDEVQPVVAAQPEPKTSTITPQIDSPPPRPVQQIQKKKEARKPKTLKVSKEFTSAFAPGFSPSKAVESELAKKAKAKPPEPEQEDSEETQDAKPQEEPELKETEETGKVQSDTSPPSNSKHGGLPLIRAPKTPQAKATVERSDKDLIERSSLDNYAIANYLLRGLYRAERLKQINPRKAQFGQAQSMARLLRRGYSIDKSLRHSGLSAATFDNLLGHGGVGK